MNVNFSWKDYKKKAKAKAAQFLASHLNVNPSYEAIRKQYLRYDAFSTLLHYEAFDFENELFVNRNSIGFVFEIPPISGADQTIYTQFQDLFKHILPIGSNLQFFLLASNRIHGFYDQWAEARSGTIFHELAQRRAAFFKSQTQYSSTKGFVPKTFRVLVSFSTPLNDYNPLEADKILKLKRKIKALFSAICGSPKNMGPYDLSQTLSEIFELKDSFYYKPCMLNPLDPLNIQMIEPYQDFEIHPDGIYQQSGKYCLKLFQVTQYPRSWNQAMMDGFIGDGFNDFLQIGCPFFLHYGIHIVDHKNLSTKFLAKSSHIDRMATSPIAKWMPGILKEQEEWQFVRSEIEEGQRVVRTRFQAGLFGDTEFVQNEGESQLKSVFSSNRWGIDADTAQLPALISTLPMSWGSGAYEDAQFFQKMKTTLSSEPVNLLPIQGEWKGNSLTGMMLFGRRGQIFCFDPFENQGGNYNVSVLGKSGAGKSVFMQELIFSTVGRGGRAYIFDSGKSFEKITKRFDGEFIDLGDPNLCINPFNYLNEDDQKSLENGFIALKAIIGRMAANHDHLGDLEYAFIDQAILNVWTEEAQNGSIDDVIAYLKSHTHQRANELGEKLFPYSSKGVHGKLFCGKSNLSLDKQIITLELGNVPKELLDLVTLILFTKIRSNLYEGDRKTPTIVNLDEGWKYITNASPTIIEFVNNFAREFRKLRASLVIGTQSLGDLFSNELAKIIFENSDSVCYLTQKGATLDQHQKEKRINLNPYQEKMLKSLCTKSGEYSEIAICISDEVFAVGRLRLDPFSNLLYSTKPDEIVAIDNHLEQGKTITQAIEAVIKERQAA